MDRFELTGVGLAPSSTKDPPAAERSRREMSECLFCQCQHSLAADYPRSTRFNNKEFRYVQCRLCDLIYLQPFPSPEDLRSIYSQKYHDDLADEPSKNLGDTPARINLLAKTRTILDFGCGHAVHLKSMLEKGFDCVGVEFNPDFVEHLRETHPTMRFYTVDDFWQSAERFGVIRLGDVLEHLENPALLLQQLKERLVDNGVFWIEGPLENNFHPALVVRKILSFLRRGRPAEHVPYHASFSNARNQHSFFRRAKLETVAWEVREDPWPYPETPHWNPRTMLFYLIGQLSIKLSRHASRTWGNRFLYLGSPTRN